jgi:hypothetical protein
MIQWLSNNVDEIGLGLIFFLLLLAYWRWMVVEGREAARQRVLKHMNKG